MNRITSLLLEKRGERGKLLDQMQLPFTLRCSLENRYARQICDTRSSTHIPYSLGQAVWEKHGSELLPTTAGKVIAYLFLAGANRLL